MAINVRYGSAGDVGALAQRSGQGIARNQQAGRDQQLVSSVLDYYNNQDANRLAAARLQLDRQELQRINASRTPMGSSDIRVGGPFAQSVQDQLPSQQSTYRPSAPVEGQGFVQTAGFDQTQQGTRFSADGNGISGVQDGSNLMSPRQIQQRGGGFVSGQSNATVDPAVAQKMTYLEQYKSQLTPGELAGLSELAKDGRVTIEDLAVRANDSLRRSRPAQDPATSTVDTRFDRTLEDRRLRDEERNIKDDERALFDSAKNVTGGENALRTVSFRDFGTWLVQQPEARRPQLLALKKQQAALEAKKQEIGQQRKALTTGAAPAAAAASSKPAASSGGDTLLNLLRQAVE